jgi:hypothetical protein
MSPEPGPDPGPELAPGDHSKYIRQTGYTGSRTESESSAPPLPARNLVRATRAPLPREPICLTPLARMDMARKNVRYIVYR